jgi:hypothetical protein
MEVSAQLCAITSPPVGPRAPLDAVVYVPPPAGKRTRPWSPSLHSRSYQCCAVVSALSLGLTGACSILSLGPWRERKSLSFSETLLTKYKTAWRRYREEHYPQLHRYEDPKSHIRMTSCLYVLLLWIEPRSIGRKLSAFSSLPLSHLNGNLEMFPMIRTSHFTRGLKQYYRIRTDVLCRRCRVGRPTVIVAVYGMASHKASHTLRPLLISCPSRSEF